ncbi:antibiotic biosynthesis monooxygenase [Paracrocinitomix mangrovi]|uniref:putative quinol monooxygenase n=1 Tax=Paracrocinitomix mangrovi TaxID=2862509 RepID=UPI001C8EA2FB|nr:antibiotic biosynthesis monooxygenase family protein [Paracrocinitomix mangrovi]UKN02898.1 antibiotic biosynthesis monooxygenase [Paracrocinitomix mangrovi]
MSIQRLVKMTFKKDRCDDFQQYFTEIQNRIESQPGCEGVKLLKDHADSGIFFTYSVWKDQASIDAYRNTELFGQVWPKVKEWFDDKPEAWSTELIK